MLMIAASSSTTPDVAYTVLVSIYSYVVLILVRFFVATGLLYLRYREGKSWLSSRGFRPWGGPTAALIYSSVFGFLLIAFLIPPAAGSPFTKESRGVDWYIVPCIGLGFLALVSHLSRLHRPIRYCGLSRETPCGSKFPILTPILLPQHALSLTFSPINGNADTEVC